MTTEEIKKTRLRETLWSAYCERKKQNAARIAEHENRAISCAGVTMKYGMKIVGEPDENGLDKVEAMKHNYYIIHNLYVTEVWQK